MGRYNNIRSRLVRHYSIASSLRRRWVGRRGKWGTEKRGEMAFLGNLMSVLQGLEGYYVLRIQEAWLGLKGVVEEGEEGVEGVKKGMEVYLGEVEGGLFIGRDGYVGGELLNRFYELVSRVLLGMEHGARLDGNKIEKFGRVLEDVRKKVQEGSEGRGR